MGSDGIGAGAAMRLRSFRAPSDREVVVERHLAAPLSLVYAAWTDPGRIAAWWGPRGLRNAVEQMDVRAGGMWRIVQTAPDGTVHPFRGTYLEVAPPDRLVFTQHYDVEPYVNEPWVVTATFAEEPGGTRVRLSAVFASPESLAEHMQNGMKRGWLESLDRLAEELLTIAAGDDLGLVAVRLLDAPADALFAMWTEPQHVARWWGPRGFTTTVDAMDVRPGGQWRFIMQGPDGTRFSNEIVYVDVRRPRLLVYEHLAEPWFRHEVSFRGQGGQTEVAVRMVFRSPEGRRRAIRDFHAAVGLQQTLDRLAREISRD